MTDKPTPITEDAERELRALYERATPGTLIACGWGDGSSQMGMTNVFNEDAEALLMECIPEHDAAAIVALHNAFPALLAALDEARARADRAEAACKTASAWLEGWGQHAGRCNTADICICGMARVRYELSDAIAAGQHRERGE